MVELSDLLVRTLTRALRLVKLEGDAVLCYANADDFADGGRLLDLIELCYFDFSERLVNMQRLTTCRCAACASMGSLDLKFIVHFGTFLIQHVAGVEDLAGPDVILLHRLMKNSISEATGYAAYGFFTDACLARIPQTLALRRHEETYESLGRVTEGVYDLKPVLASMRESRSEFIDEQQADFSITIEFDAPAELLWQYWVDPEKRVRWQTDIKEFTNAPNNAGRLGVGAVSHCSHGSWAANLRYIDWRPFHYFTDELQPTKGGLMAAPAMTETVEFLPTANGTTEMHYRSRCKDWRGRLKMRAFAPMVRRMFQSELARLRDVLAQGQ